MIKKIMILYQKCSKNDFLTKGKSKNNDLLSGKPRKVALLNPKKLHYQIFNIPTSRDRSASL